MLNYLKKFTLEILPSVAATVIGAYIVNHYISKPANAPMAARVAPANIKKIDAKPDGASNFVGIPAPGVTARGISERAMMEKSASERPAEVIPAEKAAEAKSGEVKSGEVKSGEVKSGEVKPAEVKPAEAKPTETASAPADSRRHLTVPAPKAIAKTTPAPAASPTATVEAAAAPAPAEEHRDANDLARAAIERLRGADSQRQESSRSPEASRTVAPASAAVRPLPPPIAVSAPPVEAPAATASVRNDDPSRPTPPADIPPSPPIDLRADAGKPTTHTTNMAQDMLAATKSMFHALLPNTNSNGQSSSASQFTE
jgi:hypothetical protein